MMSTAEQQVKHFLETGEYDPLPTGWADDCMTSVKLHNQAMREALIVETRRRAKDISVPELPVLNHIEHTRNKVTPMVNGLFPQSERANVLSMLEKSMVILTAENLAEHLSSVPYLSTARDLANLYLTNIGAETFGGSASRHVGLNEGTSFYLSHAYFKEQNRFADYVVHEAAHAFHNCRRSTVGLSETRTREHLLNIAFAERETFAYACEVYARILELADNAKARVRLAEESEHEFDPPDDKVDLEKFRTAVRAAAKARNGWKQILRICSPERKYHMVLERG